MRTLRQGLRHGVRMLIAIVFTLPFCILAPGSQQTGDSVGKKQPVTFEELRKIVQEIDKRMLAVRERGNTLTLLDTLRALEAEYSAKGPAAQAAIATRILTVAPEVGNYVEALRYADLAYGSHAMGRLANEAELKGYQPVEALNALASAAATAQVVMINEAHHVPQHRAFVMELLKTLRQSGFSYFATETLYETDTRLNERGYPTTQIDPFTIDQTEMTEHSAREFEHPLYRYVIERRRVSRPTVFRNAKGQWWSLERDRRDVTLFHPPSRYSGGRPDWLRLGGSRSPYQLPKKVCRAAPRCLVRARITGEGSGAIPIDQLEVLAGRPSPALILPAGEFIVEIEDPEGKPIMNFSIRRGRQP